MGFNHSEKLFRKFVTDPSFCIPLDEYFASISEVDLPLANTTTTSRPSTLQPWCTKGIFYGIKHFRTWNQEYIFNTVTRHSTIQLQWNTKVSTTNTNICSHNKMNWSTTMSVYWIYFIHTIFIYCSGMELKFSPVRVKVLIQTGHI